LGVVANQMQTDVAKSDYVIYEITGSVCLCVQDLRWFGMGLQALERPIMAYYIPRSVIHLVDRWHAGSVTA